MLKIVLVGYDKMLYSLIKGIKELNENEFKIVGVLRTDRLNYNNFELFFKDLFNPSQDFTVIKSQNLYDIKAKSVNSKEFLKEIKKLQADLIIVGSWGEKFKKEILNMLPCINFHPALLPKNRGANPYFWAIYLNQKVTGLTIHFMNEKFDRGDIILQEPITISKNETGKSLKDKTTRLACVMVKEFLNLYKNKQIQPIKQDEKFSSYEPQLSSNEITINLNKNKIDLYRHLRALYPWATPYIQIGNRYIDIKKYEFIELGEKYRSERNYKIIKENRDFLIIKGSDYLLKIRK